MKTNVVEQYLNAAEHHAVEAAKHEKLAEAHYKKQIAHLKKHEWHTKMGFIALGAISPITEEKHGTAVANKEG